MEGFPRDVLIQTGMWGYVVPVLHKLGASYCDVFALPFDMSFLITP